MGGRGLRVSIKAVLVGLIVDLAGSLLFGAASGVALGIILAVRGGAGAAQLEAGLESNVWILLSSLVGGCAFTVLGGFVAGRMARQRQLLHGLLVGLASVVVFLLFVSQTPLWYSVAGMLVTPPAGAAGGFLARRP